MMKNPVCIKMNFISFSYWKTYIKFTSRSKHLNNIIKFVDQLNDAETSDIEPLTSPLEKVARTRPDNITAKNRKETFLKNAPSSNEDYILVPRVVE